MDHLEAVAPPSPSTLWLQQANFSLPPSNGALSGEARADVCIIGGGYVGLWTALRLKELDAAVNVTLLEAQMCGSGASGRNTGQALPLWSKAGSLIAHFGLEQARWIADESQNAVSEIERFAAAHDADIDFQPTGWLWLATAAAQFEAARNAQAACSALGVNPFRPIDAVTARRLTGSSAYLGGVFLPTAANLHPGRLGAALRRAVLDSGVNVHEFSAVRLLDGENGRAVTAAGAVSASAFVIALGGWAGRLRYLRRRLIPVSAEMIATEPIPDRLDTSGWTTAAVTNSRLTLRFARSTPDGRLVFGQAGVHLGFAGRVTSRFHIDHRHVGPLAGEIARFAPVGVGAKITHAWAGPVDRSVDGLPMIGSLPRTRTPMIYAAGFSGNGVAPALLAAKCVSSLVIGRADDYSRCALVERPVQRFPPEPIRFSGGLLVRSAVRRKEGREERGLGSGALTRRLADLAPSGLAVAAAARGPDADS